MSEYTLVLSFDYNQITESLRYAVWDKNQQRYYENFGGRTAGTFNFNQGDAISVMVIGGYEKSSPPQSGNFDFEFT